MSQDQTSILQIVPALDTGGAERTTVDVAAALARHGYRALVATKGGRMVNELAHAGGEWIALNLDTKAPQSLIANIYRLANLIRRQKIALVHARSRAPAWSAYFAARRAGVPFVTTYHGIYNAQNSLKRFYNSVMARGDVVIANSNWTAEHIAKEYSFQPRRLVVIPRGVDFSRFNSARITQSRIANMRARWGCSPEDVVVLLPGRLTRWKGQTVFLDALAHLKSNGGLGQIKAALIGDSQGRSAYQVELQKQINANGLASHVCLTGHEADMPTAYSAADIVVSASTDPEAFGRVPAEAGAMNRLTIATDHGGARETVLQGRSGLLVPPGDPVALAQAIKTIATMTPDARRAMGEEARAHVAAHFTVERMCVDTLAIYQGLLEPRRKR